MKWHWFLGISFFLLSCTSDAKRVVKESSSSELTQLYDKGEDLDDKELKQSVRFLIANMPFKYSMYDGGLTAIYNTYIDSLENVYKESATAFLAESKPPKGINRVFQKSQIFDIKSVNADSLWQDILLAQKVWKQTAWCNKYDKQTFDDYVLPYRIDTECLDYHWRALAHADFTSNPSLKCTDPLQVCIQLNEQLPFTIYSLFRRTALQSYAHYRKVKRGTCNDQSLYTAMVMRALGLPVAIDVIPQWGSHNLGHTLNALIMPDHSIKGFNTTNDLREGLKLSNKVPKIYRKMYRLQKETPLYRYRESEIIPSNFADFNLMDVTGQYNTPTADVIISPLFRQPQGHVGYLAVPNRFSWEMVAWGEKEGKELVFREVGYGYNAEQTEDKKGEELGRGIVYLPVIYTKEGQQAINHPFVLGPKQDIRYLIPDTENRETVKLYRKYPKFERIMSFASSLELCVIEGANKSDFRDAVPLYTITDTPQSRLQKVTVNNTTSFRYVRIRKGMGGFSLGELKFFDMEGRELKGKIISDEAISEEPSLQAVFDGDILSFFYCSGAFHNLWIGLRLNVAQQIGSVAFSPRTDGNDICPGDHYELFYWNKEKWSSLGRKKAKDYYLNYENVPRNALLLLRNLTCGKEERPFTYEKSKQIWW